MSRRSKKRWEDTEYRKKLMKAISKGCKKYWENPKNRKRRSELSEITRKKKRDKLGRFTS